MACKKARDNYMAAISPSQTAGATVMGCHRCKGCLIATCHDVMTALSDIIVKTVMTIKTVMIAMHVITVITVMTDMTVLVDCMTVALTTWLRCHQLARRKVSSTPGPGGASPQSGQLGKMFSPCTSLLYGLVVQVE